MFSYHFNDSDIIKRYLIEIEAIKLSFENSRHLPQIEQRILRESILRSSVFSARIEGNPLHLSDYTHVNDLEIHKIEINNLLKAYRQLYTSVDNPILSFGYIKSLHSQVMNNLSSSAGKYRQEPWAIFDQSGNTIYLAPPFMNLPPLMAEYLNYLSALSCHPVIKSAIAQFIFEKIHPFADGNGRTGRLISASILKQYNYHLRGMIPFEEYTDLHRQAYYYALEPSSDMTEFVGYFLNSIITTSKLILQKLSGHHSATPNLSLRRQEILNIIGDHPNCSFDFIQRRFSAINPKTLHYDLKKLLDTGLIAKLGATRGAVYRLS